MQNSLSEANPPLPTTPHSHPTSVPRPRHHQDPKPCQPPCLYCCIKAEQHKKAVVLNIHQNLVQTNMAVKL